MGASDGAKERNQLGGREAAVLADHLGDQVYPASNRKAAVTGEGGQVDGSALWVGLGEEVELCAAVVVVSGVWWGHSSQGSV